MTSIKDFMGSCPFEGMDKDNDFVVIDDLVGKEIAIDGIFLFENDKGPGVSVKIGDKYFTTHAVGIVAACKRIDAADYSFTEGGPITATLVKRKSQKSDRMVYALE